MVNSIYKGGKLLSRKAGSASIGLQLLLQWVVCKFIVWGDLVCEDKVRIWCTICLKVEISLSVNCVLANV